MSFAAEPYGVFVDDLISSLTGAITREDFVFLAEREPFRLAFGRDYVRGTVRVHGLAGGAFKRFEDGVDYAVDGDGVLTWKAPAAGPVAGVALPDPGSHFYASYERVPDAQAPPRLTDRNPGSVLRTLAESFAREYAVISRQMESVYLAAFLDTAGGRDLDHVAALVGIVRRQPTFASGEVVLARRSPAPADIFVPEGTRISTSDVPPVSVVTTDARTLRSGNLSVAVPVQAEIEGAPGIARGASLTVVNRPILGVDSASNPFTLTLGASTETDESLRRRASRALETSGRATVGSLIGALTSIEGIRPRDVRITEDYANFPGLVKVVVAADLDEARTERAAALLEEHRAAGIRLVHNLPVKPAIEPVTGSGGVEQPVPPPATATGVTDGTRYEIGITVVAMPVRADLTTADRAALVREIEAAVKALVDSLAIGESLVYNRLVGVVMAVDGVGDAVIEAFPVADGIRRAGRSNITPVPADTRLSLSLEDSGALEVSVWGALVALDVTATITPGKLWATADQESIRYDARIDIRRRLAAYARTLRAPAKITRKALQDELTRTELYEVYDGEVHFTYELVEDGLRITEPDTELTLHADQVVWARSVDVAVVRGTAATPVSGATR